MFSNVTLKKKNPKNKQKTNKKIEWSHVNMCEIELVQTCVLLKIVFQKASTRSIGNW